MARAEKVRGVVEGGGEGGRVAKAGVVAPGGGLQLKSGREGNLFEVHGRGGAGGEGPWEGGRVLRDG